MSRIKRGARVEVTRIDGSKARGYALKRVKHLAHIGEFWLVGDLVEQGMPMPCTPVRKRKGETIWVPFGMYAPEDMRTLAGAPRKDL